MIISTILDALKGVLSICFGFIPVIPVLPGWISSFVNLCTFPFKIIGPDILIVVFYDIEFWVLALQGWAIVEWVYKKIPGIK